MYVPVHNQRGDPLTGVVLVVWPRTCEKLKGLERRTVGAEKPLSPLDKALLVTHEIPDLDNVACHSVVKDLDSLGRRYTSGEELDEIAGVQNGSGIECFPCCSC